MCIVGTGVPDGPQAHDTGKRTAREGGPYEENLDGAAMRLVGKGFIPSVAFHTMRFHPCSMPLQGI